MYTLERWLAEIAGLARVTLQPAAGAHGELTGLLLMRAYHEARGRAPHRILIPDTAHGTNPASVVMAGYEPVTRAERRARRRRPRGGCRAHRRTRATSPASCSPTRTPWACSSEHIVEIAAARARGRRPRSTTTAPTRTPCSASRGPATWASTSSTSTCTRPSRRRTAAAGPAPARSSCGDSLEPFLAGARLVECAASDGTYFTSTTTGRSRSARCARFYGNVGVLVRAYAYIRALGRRRPAPGERTRRAQRELRAGRPPRSLRRALRAALHARVRASRPTPLRAARGAGPRRRQAAARPRRPSADHLLPAHRRGGADDRADRDRVAGDRSTA